MRDNFGWRGYIDAAYKYFFSASNAAPLYEMDPICSYARIARYDLEETLHVLVNVSNLDVLGNLNWLVLESKSSVQAAQ
jgi:hypothetical protein